MIRVQLTSTTADIECSQVNRGVGEAVWVARRWGICGETRVRGSTRAAGRRSKNRTVYTRASGGGRERPNEGARASGAAGRARER